MNLGPFELLFPIGSGGMGMVWRARHRIQGTSVAIKILTEAAARRPGIVRAFRYEIRNQARLDHPGIAVLFDQGEVPDAVARRVQGVRWPIAGQPEGSTAETRLEAGSPWLAMEFAPHGSLDRYRQPLYWAGIRGVLLALLDALAHAHARGVIHRDLKPENLLVTRHQTEPGGAPLIKVSDFGIAHALFEDAATPRFSGTPRYMAPEQFLGHLHEQGPWTDLYAVGCIAYELITGRPPFPGTDAVGLRNAHLVQQPRPVKADASLPKGVDLWVATLLEKEPQRRFQFAADAAWALLSLGDPHGDAETRNRFDPHRIGNETITFEPRPVSTLAWALDESTEETGIDLLRLSRERRGKGVRIRTDRFPPAPFPRTWRRPEVPVPSMDLVGAGLGLFGMRAVRMVGREQERDDIWGTLAEVRRNGRARLVLIHGVAGIGKSHLAEWVAERFHEVGGGQVLRAVHTSGGTTSGALERMVAQHLGCTGLNRTRAARRIREALHRQGCTDLYEARAITAFLYSDEPALDPEESVRFRGPEERYALLRRLFLRSAGDRPLLVWLEDVHWDPDALGLASFLMAEQDVEPVPFLLLLTAQDDVLDDGVPSRLSSADEPSVLSAAEPINRIGFHGRLRALLSIRGCSPLHLGPLPHAEHTALVHRLLGLSGELATQVEERTAGNPLFAVQLVGDWVRRGVLEPGRYGFQLHPGTDPVLPDDIHQVWSERVAGLLHGRPSHYAAALELAGFLGMDVDADEWRAACEASGVRIPDDLVDDLVKDLVWVARNNGWSFAHSMMRESLLREAREAGRARPRHLACASVLRPAYEAGRRGQAERYGRHLLAAGERESAIEPLFRGASERFGRGELDSALSLLGACRRAMQRCRIPDEHALWGRLWLLAGEILLARGRLSEAMSQARAAQRSAQRHAWRGIHARSMRLQGQVVMRQGELLRARELYRTALELYSEVNDEIGVADCMRELAGAFATHGELPAAHDHAEQALEIYQRRQNSEGIANALLQLGDIALATGEYDDADLLYRRALTAYQATGDLIGRAACLKSLGTAARLRGDLDGADGHYREALDCYETAGSSDSYVVRLNMCLSLFEQGRFEEARVTLDLCGLVFARMGRRAYLGCVHALQLCHAAQTRNWVAWRLNHRRAERLLGASGMVEQDLATSLQTAGRMASAASEPDRAREAYRLAITQWSALGRQDKVDETGREVEALDRSGG